MSCSTAAASSGGKASRRRNDVTNCACTKKGKRMYDSPFARSWMIVTMKLTEPRSDEVIRKTIPTSHHVCPADAITDNGGYDVQPDCAVPPGTKKLASMISPPGR